MDTFRLEEPLDPALIDALLDIRDSAELAGRLLAAAQHFDAVEEVFVYRAGTRGTPTVLLSSSSLVDVKRRVSMYAADFFQRDPVSFAKADMRLGHGFTLRVRADEIRDEHYRQICFEAPRLADKLCFGWRHGEQRTVLSFYRAKGGRKRLSRRLSALANVGLAAASRLSLAPAEPEDFILRIEAAIARCYPELSERERQVCSRSVAGWTAPVIAGNLGIKTATVLTYRQRAYGRLGFARASDFLPMLIGHRPSP